LTTPGVRGGGARLPGLLAGAGIERSIAERNRAFKRHAEGAPAPSD
jgi:hypothetical protein